MMAPDDITLGPDGNDEEPSGTYEYVEEVVEYKDTRGLRTLLAVVLVILLLLLAGVGYLLWTSSKVAGGAAAQAGTNKMTWVRSIYGWGTGQDQQLIAPTAVATAPDGAIWSNSQNRVAVAFNTDGSLDRLVMSNPATATAKPATATPTTAAGARSDPGGVQAVSSISVDGNNNLFIGDDASGRVLKFTPEGRFLQGWSIPGLVKAAASDSLVAIVGKDKLGVFKQSTGAPVFDFGTRGQGKDQFDLPIGVHVDGAGNVYVADTQNQRVRKYSPSGRLLWDAGTVPDRVFKSHVEAPKGIFQLPTGVTTDATGRVVVTDAFNYSITVLDGVTGKKIASYGDYGQNDGQFDNPSAIAYDSARDYFVIADTGNNRLQVVRIPGSAPVTATSVLRRAFENPIWILCLPFLILLLAILVTALMRRRRREKERAEAAAAAAAEADAE
jgi:cbb3-type cytochrome oxidase subunit 3